MITRRDFIWKGIGAAAVSPMSLSWAGASWNVTAASEKPESVEELYRRAIIIDTATNSDGPGVDASKAISAGLTATVADLPIYPRNMPNALEALEQWNKGFSWEGSLFLKVLKADDIRRAKEEKKLGIILMCQDGSILDASTCSVNDYNLQVLKKLFDLGLRVMTLTHNERNAVADSFREKNDAGLSRLGEKVVEAMNQIRMLIDLAHCSDKTTMEAIGLSKSSCAITHAGCRALYATKRNKTDEQIKALADKGGVIGIYNMTLWLTDRPTCSISDIVDHIDHAVKVGGIDHVSFGSDGPILETDVPEDEQLAGMQSYAKRNLGLPGAERIPQHVLAKELNTPSRLLRLADALAKRGFKLGDIEKIIGGNFFRLFREVCG
jgi:membrane dipeptidase